MNEEIKNLSDLVAIKRYFENIKLAELKALSFEDRKELGELCREALIKGE